MNKLFYIGFILAIVAGCKDKTEPPKPILPTENSLTISYDGFNNKLLNQDTGHTEGYYQPSTNLTTFNIISSSDSFDITINGAFTGQNATNVPQGNVNYVTVELTRKNNPNDNRSYGPSSNGCALKITKYGPVGGTIEGEYSGDYVRTVNGNNVHVYITKGHFVVRRFADR